MSEENQNPEQPTANDNADTTHHQPPIIINTQYIKDFSLEIPHAPEIFRNLSQAPEVNIDVDVHADHLHDNYFNVSLKIRIDGIVGTQPLFILEIDYCGITALNVPEEHLEPVLLIEIPRMLFPYARSYITTSLIAAGLPPLMINPIDFVAMYQNRKQKPSEQPQPEQN